MPTFVFDTDKYIEAMVQAVYPWEKTAKGILIYQVNNVTTGANSNNFLFTVFWNFLKI